MKLDVEGEEQNEGDHQLADDPQDEIIFHWRYVSVCAAATGQ
jgi:hypothetical protein